MTHTAYTTHIACAGGRGIASRAMAILAVDDIKVSERGRELLAQCEAGTMSFAQAREDVIARARAMALAARRPASNTKPALF